MLPKNKSPLLPLLLLWFCIPAMSQDHTAALQSHEEIRKAVSAYLRHRFEGTGGKVDIEVNRLDPRLRLPRCRRPLDLFLPPGAHRSARITVGVRCEGASRWKIYLGARVHQQIAVVVAGHDLKRGQRIGPGDVRLERRDLGDLRGGYTTDPRKILGWTTRRSIHRGQPLDPARLFSAGHVRRGDMVTLVARSGSIEVRMKGRALAAADPGQRIRVENLSSGRRLDGRLLTGGLVRIGP